MERELLQAILSVLANFRTELRTSGRYTEKELRCPEACNTLLGIQLDCEGFFTVSFYFRDIPLGESELNSSREHLSGMHSDAGVFLPFGL